MICKSDPSIFAKSDLSYSLAFGISYNHRDISMSALERYIDKLKTTDHPPDMQEFVQLVILALESPTVFFAQYKVENEIHQCAMVAALEVVDTLNVPEQIKYLKLRGIHEATLGRD